MPYLTFTARKNQTKVFSSRYDFPKPVTLSTTASSPKLLVPATNPIKHLVTLEWLRQNVPMAVGMSPRKVCLALPASPSIWLWPQCWGGRCHSLSNSRLLWLPTVMNDTHPSWPLLMAQLVHHGSELPADVLVAEEWIALSPIYLRKKLSQRVDSIELLVHPGQSWEALWRSPLGFLQKYDL